MDFVKLETNSYGLISKIRKTMKTNDKQWQKLVQKPIVEIINKLMINHIKIITSSNTKPREF